MNRLARPLGHLGETPRGGVFPSEGADPDPPASARGERHIMAE